MTFEPKQSPREEHPDEEGEPLAEPNHPAAEFELDETDPFASDEDLVVVSLEEDEEVKPPPLSGRSRPRGQGRGRPRSRSKTVPTKPRQFTPGQRLLILDCWQRSNLQAKDFAPLVGCSAAVLYKWRKNFEANGPAGLEDGPKGGKPGSRLNEVTRRTILLLKEAHPEWGEERIHFELQRSKGMQASAGAIGRVLSEDGYELEARRSRPHPDKKRRFERAKPNQLWQTDLFTFVLKRQSRRVHMVAFMDDHSRFVVGYGLHATASGALVREVFEAAISNHGRPEEVLTDNGAQYVTWRGKSAFTKLCERRGIKQIVATPRRPQTLGKVERFWGTLWRDCVESAVFLDLEDARRRVGLFMDHYNFHRTHQGIGGLVPADRFFSSAPEVKETLAKRVVGNALELARDGLPRKDFYLTGRVGDVGISLHAEGEQVILTSEDGTREAVNLSATGPRREGAEDSLPEPVTVSIPTSGPGLEEPNPPGVSPLDDALATLDSILDPEGAGWEEEAE